MTTIRDAASALRARKVSCEELVKQALSAEEAKRDLNCFITLTADQALAEARQLDAELAGGQDRGPLHGIPIAHKDLCHTAGVRTTNGTRIFADFVPERDAVVVSRLRDAGAISIGKLNMHELAYGITSNNPHYGPVRNPHDRERIPGGSSGGSGSAVAAGIVFGATGSDTGGSIRIPASFCGTVGFKPTFELVSTEGCFPLGASLDHMGPLARTVEDTAWMLEGMSGRSFPIEPRAEVRMGLPENFYFDGVDPEVHVAVERAAKRAEKSGATIVRVRVPDPDGLMSTARTILLCEAATVMLPHVKPRHEFGADVLALLDTGTQLPATEYINALRAAAHLKKTWAKLFEQFDVLLTPTIPITAPRIGQTTVHIGNKEEDTRLLTTRFCRGINLLGYPALSIPCGSSREGLPIGLQIIGGWNEDATVLNVGAALEDRESASR
jgi:aspartyl-tRNA(Asn)/glutamyl-tRNA(Gln) amidotransferase subunit A